MNSLSLSSLSFTVIAVVYVTIAVAGMIIIGTRSETTAQFYFSKQVDAMIFGKPTAEVNRDSPEFGRYITRLMMVFCSLMVGMGILQFALARLFSGGGHWAYWASVLSNVAMLAIYWFVITIPVMKEYNVSYFSFWHPYAFIPTLLLPIGAISGAIGLYAK